MASTATVTGKAGPDQTLTAVVFNDIDSFKIVTATEILTLEQDGRFIDISIAAATTITVTVSGNNYTLTVA